jgi:DNA polymerase V
MSATPVIPYERLIPVQSSPMWLQLCAWKVPAGFASPASDHTEKRIDLNDHLISNMDATSLFRVQGDSMIDAGIFPNDVLLVDRSMEARHNHIVLACVNNEFTLKRLYRRGGVVKLVPENKMYPPIVLMPNDELRIVGVVTFNLHKLT